MPTRTRMPCATLLAAALALPRDEREEVGRRLLHSLDAPAWPNWLERVPHGQDVSDVPGVNGFGAMQFGEREARNYCFIMAEDEPVALPAGLVTLQARCAQEAERAPVITERIADGDATDEFWCSHHSTGLYFVERAVIADRADIARAFVLRARVTHPPSLPDVHGFYTLSIATAGYSTASSEALWRALADFPTPFILIGRFGVHEQLERTGIGTLLLGDALVRAVMAADMIAASGVMVLAPDEKAERFCKHYGFAPLNSPDAGWPRRMFLRLTQAVREQFRKLNRDA